MTFSELLDFDDSSVNVFRTAKISNVNIGRTGTDLMDHFFFLLSLFYVSMSVGQIGIPYFPQGGPDSKKT